MPEKDFASLRRLPLKWLSRRGFIRASAGAAGAGLALGSGLQPRAFAQGAAHKSCPDLPRPIPHISTPPGLHGFFPGPVTGPADPSQITDFKGMIGQADLFFSGMGTDLNTGESAPYGFHTDWRFMTGVFVGVDGLEHNGTLSFI